MEETKKLVSVLCSLSLLCAAFVCGCGGSDGGGDNPPPPPPPVKAISLQHFASCGEVEEFTRAAMIKEADDSLDEQMVDTCRHTEMGVMDATGGDGGSGVSFTDTNVQEAGVDEADMIKTNGDYTFVLAKNKLHIVKTWPVSNLSKVSSVDIEGTPVSLYLVNDKVVVFSNIVKGGEASAQASKAGAGMATAAIYGSWVSSNSDTKLTFIDVANKSSPQVTRESYYRGSFNTARRIGDEIYVVVKPPIETPKISMSVSDYDLFSECGKDGKPKAAPSKELKDAVAKIKEENRTSIESWNVASGTKLQGSKISCTSISRSDAVSGSSMVGITRVMPDGTEADDKSEFVLAGSGPVYANADSIYVTSPKDNTDATVIHRFALGTQEDGPAYFGSAEVEGWVLNQFALSEFDGHLRVVTTTGHANKAGETVSSMVSVIDAGDQDLPVVGTVGDIGAGEEVKSVRFIGSRGYVVTFKKIDPLFILDLSDPKGPAIAGELKVPGFSTYLHPLDRDHLLGLGKDADDQASFAWFQGLKLSIYDVSDSADPKEDASVVIGSRGTMSPAFESHMAFTFDTDKGMLALPLTLCEGTKGGSETGKFSYNGVQVYDIGADSGIDLASELKEQTTPNEKYQSYGYSSYECNGWSYVGDVQRTVIMGNDDGTYIMVLKNSGVSIYSEKGDKEKGISW